MATGNPKLAPIPSIIRATRGDLDRLNEDAQRFSVDAINRFKTLQLQILDLQRQIDVFETGGPFTGLATTGPSGIDAGDVQVLGSSTQAARADHVHDVNTGAGTQGIGGGNAEGSGADLARANHDHAIRETSGPTDLTVASVFALDTFTRVGATIAGRTLRATHNTNANQTNSTTTLADFITIALPKAGTYAFFAIAGYNTAVATTALNLAIDYSGTTTSVNMRGTVQDSTTTFLGISVTALNTKVQPASGTGFPNASGNGIFMLWGDIVVTTAGTLALRFCSEVAASQVLIAGPPLLVVVEE